MNNKEAWKHYAIGFVAAIAFMALIRIIYLAQDGGLESRAFLGGDNTVYCVNPENPNETCVSPGGGGGQTVEPRPSYGEVIGWAITGIAPRGPRNNPYTPNP